MSYTDIYKGLTVSFKRVLKLFRELESCKQDTVTIITNDDWIWLIIVYNDPKLGK